MARKKTPAVVPPRRLKLNLSLDARTHARLSAYAAFRREDISAVVARAVEAEMRSSGFVVYLGTEPAAGSAPPAPTRAADPGGSPGPPATVPLTRGAV
jgi:hypothetical protein